MSLDAGAPVDLSEDVLHRLRAVGRAVEPGEIEELWIFPPLEGIEDSDEFVLFTRMLRDDRRRLYSAGTGPVSGEGGEARGNGGPPSPANGDRPPRIVDHGSVPADRVPRLVERFRRRVDEEGHEPVHVVVEGRADRWRELLPEPSANGHPPDAAANGAGGNGTNPGVPG